MMLSIRFALFFLIGGICLHQVLGHWHDRPRYLGHAEPKDKPKITEGSLVGNIIDDFLAAVSNIAGILIRRHVLVCEPARQWCEKNAPQHREFDFKKPGTICTLVKAFCPDFIIELAQTDDLHEDPPVFNPV